MTVLCYHTVEDDWESTLALTRTAFEQHCAWLARHRTVVPLESAVAALDRRFRPRGRISALTFDDGWTGVFENAWPILRRHGLPFTVFVITETLTDEPPSMDWVERPPDAPMNFITRDQVLEMHEAGVDVSSHTLRHADLPGLGYGACVADLRASREFLEDLLHKPIRTLAYPKGRHDAEVQRAARAAGYEAAFTLPESAERPNSFAIPRVGLYPGNDTRALWVKTRARYLDVRLSRAHETVRNLRR